MITTTFMAGCKYTGGEEGVQINQGSRHKSQPLGLDLLSFIFTAILPRSPFGGSPSSMFDPITILVHDPGQATIIVVFAVGINLNASCSQFFQQPVQVVYVGGVRSRVLQETLYRANSAAAKETLAR